MSAPDRFWLVYVITCTTPGDDLGKQYVGQCRAGPDGSSRKRWKQHCTQSTHSLRPIYEAIRAYGADAFVVEDIACCRSRADAMVCEEQTAALLNTLFPNGFNVSGSSLDRGKDQALTTQRSAVARANWERLKARGYRPTNTPETKLKRSAAIAATWKQAETAAARIAGIRAAWDKPGAREKRSAVAREVASKPEVKAKRSAASSEWQNRPEIKPTQSAAARARWNQKTPEERAAWLAKGINSPEQLEKTAQRLVRMNRAGRPRTIRDRRQPDLL